MKNKRAMMSLVLWACLAAVLCAQTITVNAPNGGERWFIGDPVSITWSSSGMSGDVRILLMLSGGATVGTIASAVPADTGSYTWTAGTLTSGTAAAGEGYVVRIRAVGSEIFDVSDAAFSLVARTQPNLMFFLPLACSSGTELKAGMNCKFSATVHSDLVRTSNVRVTGGVVGGAVLFDQAYAELAGDASQKVEFIWEVPEGAHRVYFQIDPDNAIAESNESDNRTELAVSASVNVQVLKAVSKR